MLRILKMLVIRLRRGGKKNQPHYRIVLQEKRSKVRGKYIESLGHYHPTSPNKDLTVNEERINYWIKQGASLSDTVNNLLVRMGVLPEQKRIVKRAKKLKKKEEKGEAAKAEVQAEKEKPKVESQQQEADSQTEETGAPEVKGEEESQ